MVRLYFYSLLFPYIKKYMCLGYTKGAVTPVFAARPAPIQMLVMGYASTLGSTSIVSVNEPNLTNNFSDSNDNTDIPVVDYMVCDPIGVPVHPSARQAYAEKMLYMPYSFFVNDHRGGYGDAVHFGVERVLTFAGLGEVENSMSAEAESERDEEWRRECVRRVFMRREVFPNLGEDTVIFANFNQLYKVWMDVLYNCWGIFTMFALFI
jgi:hypothetical protein